MKKFSITRFLRTRRVYWNVLQELSAYTDRELHDIGIDRADIYQIAAWLRRKSLSSMARPHLDGVAMALHFRLYTSSISTMSSSPK